MEFIKYVAKETVKALALSTASTVGLLTGIAVYTVVIAPKITEIDNNTSTEKKN